MVLLSVRGLKVTLGSKEVLKGIDMDLPGGEVVALLGPNGSGKSTLIAAAGGVGRRSGGSVDLLGEDIDTLSRRQVARRVAIVPQQTGFLMPFTVMETVLMGRFPAAGRFARLSNDDEQAAMAALEMVDLGSFGERLVTDLSGGEAQRVAIARALAQETPVLLLDEPVSALDPRHAMAVFRLLGSLKNEGKGVIVALHDINFALRFADRIVFLKEGVLHEPPSPRLVDEKVLAGIFDNQWRIETLSSGDRAAFPLA
ncbi:MAG: ABC transporter ATP-binding protein [Thermovirgaceae bacterium]|nr:ABC transporter ATP-binding protein [Thermovirgaceae bacterium]